MKKPDLVLVVGAGASIPCGILSTQELTDAAFGYVSDVSPPMDSFITLPGGSNIQRFPRAINLGEILHQGLRGAYRSVDFELFLHAIEALEGHAEPYGLAEPGQRPVMTAFADLLPRFDLLRARDTMYVARHQVVEGIHRRLASLCVLCSTQESQEARDAQATFIREVAERFRLVAIDLNYDDLLDRIDIGWEDGFRAVPGKAYSHFDPRAWLHASDGDKPLLMHLHGSVRHGLSHLNSGNPASLYEPALYDNPMEAVASFGDASQSEPMADGKTATALPFISGFDKAAKITSNVRPFAYYYLAAAQALALTPRLLVVGYGGRDQHVQAWIAEHAAIHGSNRRAAALLKRPGAEVGQLNASLRLMQILAGENGKMSAMAYDGSETAVHCTGALMFFPHGVPRAYESKDEVIEHLAGV
ncbi:MAG: SIR2 family protein [Candidatus Eremiobacteraeota bacterium]|nr:SIR2 family protein [Candidatus Eremiobacteraeota bacterium]